MEIAMLAREAQPDPPDIDKRVPLITAYIVQCSLCLVVIMIRFWARTVIGGIRGLGLDDFMMAITWAIYFGLTIMVGFLGVNGGTRHIMYIEPPAHLEYVLMLSFAAQPFGIMAVGTGKISVGFLILRILGNTGKWRRRLLQVIMVLTMFFTITNAIFNFTQCNPPAALWNAALRATASCWEPHVEINYGVFVSAWSVAMDLLLALMPATIIWGLQMSTYKRVGLIFLMGGGVFGAACTAYKTSLLQTLATRSDFTWATYDLYMWVSAEIFVICICGSIPTFKPLWNRFVKHKGNTTVGEESNGSGRIGMRRKSKAPRLSPARNDDYSDSTELWSHASRARQGDGLFTYLPKTPTTSVTRVQLELPATQGIHVSHTVEMEWAGSDEVGKAV